MKAKQLLGTACFVAALFTSSSLFAQVKVGTNPTTIESTSNLEVEASTSGRKVKVDKTTGQMTIADGTQGAGKLLTSDANGGASWKSIDNLRIPETIWIGQQSGTYTVTPWEGVHNVVKDRIPLVPRTGSIAGYNTTTKQYTIQESGYYRIHAGGNVAGTVSDPARYALVHFYIGFNGGPGVLMLYDKVSTGNRPYLTVFWEGYLTAGSTYNVFINNLTASGNVSDAQNINVTSAFMSVTKLF
ncbi:hypothetical protein [Siphonobacter curvatus]|uniref:Uncharacterized protein n=1 Tax=Siphonobacter curvatus TaxID=2094562 RepID=A0A2S7IIF3_9BACT|nr:hypothetical protein [Siphonobacter curvatus]PQA56094.1 hypothetical protein C5O19_17190 [Siphonobacter curvatus]